MNWLKAIPLSSLPQENKMGKPTGFLELDRQDRSYLPKEERVQNFREFIVPMN